NVYFYKVADSIGLDAIAEVGKDFGFGSPTGIGVVSEVPGIMPTRAWHDRANAKHGGDSRGQAHNSSGGQGANTATHPQVAMAYAAIANGGNVWVPQLVEAIESPDGKVVERFEPRLKNKVDVKPEHLALVRDGLSAVVNEPGGTAFRRRLKDVKVAGKTGTAQVVRIGAVRLRHEQREYWQRHHGWFAGYAPADAPEIAVVVLNEHGGGGGSSAAPTAMALIQKYVELKQEDRAQAMGVPAAPVPERVMAQLEPSRNERPRRRRQPVMASQAPEVTVDGEVRPLQSAPVVPAEPVIPGEPSATVPVEGD